MTFSLSFDFEMSERKQLETVLNIENLRTYFFTGEGVARAVDGVSISVGKNRTIGLVGESGLR